MQYGHRFYSLFTLGAGEGMRVRGDADEGISTAAYQTYCALFHKSTKFGTQVNQYIT